jgi:ankyrin repeat protein
MLKTKFVVIGAFFFFIIVGISLSIWIKRKAVAIHKAAYNDDIVKVEELLDKNPTLVNKRDKQGLMPLHYATWKGNPTTTKILIDNGADIEGTAQADMGGTVYEAKPIHFAARGGNPEVIKLLLDNGANVNSKGLVDWTPLHRSAVNNHMKASELLISSGADVNAKDAQKSTPLHFAADKGYADIVKLLISCGADVNAKAEAPYGGNTPLHLAVFRNYKHVLSLLLDNGADVNAKLFDNKTALDWAKENHFEEITKLLFSYVVDPNRPL